MPVSDWVCDTTRTLSARRSGSGMRPRSAVDGSSASPFSVTDETSPTQSTKVLGSGLTTAERDGGGRRPEAALVEAAQVDVHVVPLDSIRAARSAASSRVRLAMSVMAPPYRCAFSAVPWPDRCGNGRRMSLTPLARQTRVLLAIPGSAPSEGNTTCLCLSSAPCARGVLPSWQSPWLRAAAPTRRATASDTGDSPSGSYGDCQITSKPNTIDIKPVHDGTLTVETTLPAQGWWNGTTPESIKSGYEYCMAAELANMAGLSSVTVKNVSFDQLVAGQHQRLRHRPRGDHDHPRAREGRRLLDVVLRLERRRPGEVRLRRHRVEHQGEEGRGVHRHDVGRLPQERPSGCTRRSSRTARRSTRA